LGRRKVALFLSFAAFFSHCFDVSDQLMPVSGLILQFLVPLALPSKRLARCQALP